MVRRKPPVPVSTLFKDKCLGKLWDNYLLELFEWISPFCLARDNFYLIQLVLSLDGLYV